MTDLEARYNAVAGRPGRQGPELDRVRRRTPRPPGSRSCRTPSTGGASSSSTATGTIVPALGDKRVRQAMNYAVDRAGDPRHDRPRRRPHDHAGGAGQLARPTTTALDERYPFDPDMARQLLEEAGYADGFEFTATTPPTVPDVHGGDRRLPRRRRHHDEPRGGRRRRVHRGDGLGRLPRVGLHVRLGAPALRLQHHAARGRVAEHPQHDRSGDRPAVPGGGGERRGRASASCTSRSARSSPRTPGSSSPTCRTRS